MFDLKKKDSFFNLEKFRKEKSEFIIYSFHSLNYLLIHFNEIIYDENTSYNLSPKIGIKGIKFIIKEWSNLHILSNVKPLILINSCIKNNIKMIKLLLKHKFKINGMNLNGDRPLHVSSQYNKLESVKLLIEKGANLNAVTIRRWTSLMVACYWGHVDVVKLLIDAGADIKIKNRRGESALDLSTDDEIIKLLKEKI